MTPTDVAALLYRVWIRSSFRRLGFRTPEAAEAAYPWPEVEDARRADWIAVAEEAIKLAPALACPHTHEIRDDRETYARMRCCACGRTRAA